MRTARLKENQRTFRDANERLEGAVEDAVTDGPRIPFLCECADDDCLGRVELTLAEYAAVRSGDDRFLVLPHHALIPGEEVVEEHEGYQVTVK